jgi:hypothetical protein
MLFVVTGSGGECQHTTQQEHYRELFHVFVFGYTNGKETLPVIVTVPKNIPKK